ncbi:MAG: phage holin family protein [Myxococcales bacterium]
MAILQALISLISRSAGKILNAAFGWAVLALFGRTTPKEQTVLSAVVAAAAAWPLLLVGVAFPKAMVFVVSFVPLSKSVPSGILRIVWIVLALVVPLIVGSVIAARAPKNALPESRLKRLLRGFQVTFALAAAFLLMLVIAPALKIVNAVKGRKDVRLPALVQEGAGKEFMSALVAALSLYAIEMRSAEPPWHLTAPATVLKKLGGRAFANFVGEDPQYRVSQDLQVNLNPNELLLRGKERALLRAQSVAQEVMAPRCIFSCMDARAQDLEQQIKRVWRVLAERPRDHRASAALIRRRDEIARELARSEVPFDEWQIVYRELLQLDRALRGDGALIVRAAFKESEEEQMATQKELELKIEEPAPPAESRPLSLERLTNRELIGHITQNAVQLAKREVELAKAELKDDLKKEVAMAKGLGVAGLCAIWTVSLMLVACAFALSTVMAGWAAALIVAAGVLLVGTVAGLVGWGKRVQKPMEATLRTLKEDARWAKERIA